MNARQRRRRLPARRRSISPHMRRPVSTELLKHGYVENLESHGETCEVREVTIEIELDWGTYETGSFKSQKIVGQVKFVGDEGASPGS